MGYSYTFLFIVCKCLMGNDIILIGVSGAESSLSSQSCGIGSGEKILELLYILTSHWENVPGKFYNNNKGFQ